ncbi:hypothetical protein P7C71_g3721, partial [Lecanoromycetidae sp. Uapishka_2]
HILERESGCIALGDCPLEGSPTPETTTTTDLTPTVTAAAPAASSSPPAACDPENCNGDVTVGDDSVSYDCPNPAARLFRKEKREVYPPPAPAPIAVSCGNCGKIKTAKARFNGNCDPANSKGYMSSHNCPGKSYLCVLSGKATCYSGSSVTRLGAENGECFL